MSEAFFQAMKEDVYPPETAAHIRRLLHNQPLKDNIARIRIDMRAQGKSIQEVNKAIVHLVEMYEEP